LTCVQCVQQTALSMKLPPNAESENSSADSANSQQDVDFADYVWMGEEMEEFDSKVCIPLLKVTY